MNKLISISNHLYELYNEDAVASIIEFGDNSKFEEEEEEEFEEKELEEKDIEEGEEEEEYSNEEDEESENLSYIK